MVRLRAVRCNIIRPVLKQKVKGVTEIELQEPAVDQQMSRMEGAPCDIENSNTPVSYCLPAVATTATFVSLAATISLVAWEHVDAALTKAGVFGW